MQNISNDQTARRDRVQDSKDFISQSSSTQAKKGKQSNFLMPAIKDAFSLLGDDIREFSTKHDALKDKIGSYDEKWLEDSKAKLIKQTDEKRANLNV